MNINEPSQAPPLRTRQWAQRFDVISRKCSPVYISWQLKRDCRNLLAFYPSRNI